MAFPAIEQLISEGVNVNITLMFSMDHYEAVANAYINGLEKLGANGGDVSKVGSVASFFVSRVDVKIDDQLATLQATTALQGKIAIANSKVVYQRFKELFNGERWDKLAVAWGQGSAATYGPAPVPRTRIYSDTLYVDTLIGPDTVNTLPPDTLDAFLDQGTVAVTVEDDHRRYNACSACPSWLMLGIDLDKATEELQRKRVWTNLSIPLTHCWKLSLPNVTGSAMSSNSGLGGYESAVSAATLWAKLNVTAYR